MRFSNCANGDEREVVRGFVPVAKCFELANDGVVDFGGGKAVRLSQSGFKARGAEFLAVFVERLGQPVGVENENVAAGIRAGNFGDCGVENLGFGNSDGEPF